MKHVIIISLFASLAACSGLSTLNSEKKSKSDYSYSFTGSSCSTEHQFDKKRDYCDGLRNDDLNAGCAKAERDELYKRDCEKKTAQPAVDTVEFPETEG